jgi:hypothetical protein
MGLQAYSVAPRKNHNAWVKYTGDLIMQDVIANPEAQTPPPPKPKPTVLDPPIIYYNEKWRVPPLVVHTQEHADSLDPSEWMTNPPVAPAATEFPKLYFNINLAPRIVGDADEATALGGDWREFSLPEGLVTAAQAKLDAAKSK